MSYSGKKKRHTKKTLVVIRKNTKEIVCVYAAVGHVHDFKMFKDSKLHINNSYKLLADSGFNGLLKYHKNSVIPHKNSKLIKLNKEQKQQNRALASNRICIEHVNRELKIFRILKDVYRNKQKRFGLRVNLIAAITNLNKKYA